MWSHSLHISDFNLGVFVVNQQLFYPQVIHCSICVQSVDSLLTSPVSIGNLWLTPHFLWLLS